LSSSRTVFFPLCWEMISCAEYNENINLVWNIS
jgi:hypothetical protein